MEQSRRGRDVQPICVVRLDRIQFRAHRVEIEMLTASDFVRVKDHFVRSQTTRVTYRRVATFRRQKTGTTLFIQYQPVLLNLWPVKATAIANDRTGFGPCELNNLFRAFREAAFLIVEIAVDFRQAGVVDREFVLRHGRFGKSRNVGGRLFRDVRFGTRHSDILVRAYSKTELQVFRIELELHSSWLRRHGIKMPSDLWRLPPLLLPNHLFFVRWDMVRLNRYLKRKRQSAEQMFGGLQILRKSLCRAKVYFKWQAGVANPHVFLRPLAINCQLAWALRSWAARWKANDGKQSNGDD